MGTVVLIVRPTQAQLDALCAPSGRRLDLKAVASGLESEGYTVEWAEETDRGPLGLRFMMPLPEIPTFTGAGDTRGPEGEPWKPLK